MLFPYFKRVLVKSSSLGIAMYMGNKAITHVVMKPGKKQCFLLKT